MGITRNLFFTVDPTETEAPWSSTFSWTQFPDGNADGKEMTCFYVPKRRGSGVNTMQESFFLGGSSEAAKMLHTNLKELGLDGTEVIRSEWISQRIDPANRPSPGRSRQLISKRYHQMEFHSVLPQALGATLQWCGDCNPLTDPMLSWNAFGGEASDSVIDFESGLAEWVHIRMVDETTRVNEIFLEEFGINFYPLGGRDGADTGS
jgi:hypothetical protein